MTTTRLDPIVADVRRRAAERRRKLPFDRLEDHVKVDSWRRERFLNALIRPELAYICELKRRSPSAGDLLVESQDFARQTATRVPRIGARWHALADSYRRGGAAALSVLTEEDHFGGALDDLRAVEFTTLPRLRKDFILDESMVLESCLYGADAVLLIAAILDDATLTRLRAFCQEYGIAVLIEAHDELELDRAIALQPECIGVNARDLKTLQVDLATVERLLPRIPATGPNSPIKIAESGIRGVDDLKRVRAAGANAVLVGETLIRDADPERTLASWREAVRG